MRVHPSRAEERCQTPHLNPLPLANGRGGFVQANRIRLRRSTSLAQPLLGIFLQPIPETIELFSDLRLDST